jgi:hypothetical protein
VLVPAPVGSPESSPATGKSAPTEEGLARIGAERRQVRRPTGLIPLGGTASVGGPHRAMVRVEGRRGRVRPERADADPDIVVSRSVVAAVVGLAADGHQGASPKTSQTRRPRRSAP